MQSAVKEGDTRPPLKSAFDSARESSHERTWAASDTNTRALGLALKHQLSQHSPGPGGSQTPSASGHESMEVKGANAFEAEVCVRALIALHSCSSEFAAQWCEQPAAC